MIPGLHFYHSPPVLFPTHTADFLRMQSFQGLVHNFHIPDFILVLVSLLWCHARGFLECAVQGVYMSEWLWLSFLFPYFLYRVYSNLKGYKSLHLIFDDISILSRVYILWVHVHFYNQLLYLVENFPEYEKHRIVH